jgi:hypothetical protein
MMIDENQVRNKFDWLRDKITMTAELVIHGEMVEAAFTLGTMLKFCELSIADLSDEK